MSSTIDTNVLVYASNEADASHPAARELLGRLAAGPDLLYLFWPTLMGYLRIVTHPGVLPQPLTPAKATANVDGLLRLPHVRAPGEGEGFWDIYAATDADARGNAVADAHVAALMRQHGVATIYTRDREFRRFDRIKVVDPFA